LLVARAEERDLARAYRLMRHNMERYHHLHDLPWDQAWLEDEYGDKDNFSLLRGGVWIGFLSLEWREDCLFINTLQLVPELQGNIFGLKVFNWLLQQARDRQRPCLRCRSFRTNPALQLYRRLGFVQVAEQGVLVELELAVSDVG